MYYPQIVLLICADSRWLRHFPNCALKSPNRKVSAVKKSGSAGIASCTASPEVRYEDS